MNLDVPCQGSSVNILHENPEQADASHGLTLATKVLDDVFMFCSAKNFDLPECRVDSRALLVSDRNY